MSGTGVLSTSKADLGLHELEYEAASPRGAKLAPIEEGPSSAFGDAHHSASIMHHSVGAADSRVPNDASHRVMAPPPVHARFDPNFGQPRKCGCRPATLDNLLNSTELSHSLPETPRCAMTRLPSRQAFQPSITPRPSTAQSFITRGMPAYDSVSR